MDVMDFKALLSGDQSEHKPWLKNRQWASGRIRDQSNRFLFVSILLAAVFGTISVLVTVSVIRDAGGVAGAIVFAVLIDALGLLFIAIAIRQIRMRMIFGRSMLELETIPGAIGGRLAGNVRVPALLDASSVLRLELECVESTVVRPINGKTKTREETVLERKHELANADLQRDGNSTLIPVSFEIPSNARPTGHQPGREIVWRLYVHAAQPDADYEARFIVPVFRVPNPAAVALR